MSEADDLVELEDAFLDLGEIFAPDEWNDWKAAEEACIYQRRLAALEFVDHMDIIFIGSKFSMPNLDSVVAAAAEKRVRAIRRFAVAFAAEFFRNKIVK